MELLHTDGRASHPCSYLNLTLIYSITASTASTNRSGTTNANSIAVATHCADRGTMSTIAVGGEISGGSGDV